MYCVHACMRAFVQICTNVYAVSEQLEILGSIINGFALPLKPEHLRFLLTALLPLHRAPSVASYHHQLSYCIIQYIEKDSSTVVAIVKGLAKYWPWAESSKQVSLIIIMRTLARWFG